MQPQPLTAHPGTRGSGSLGKGAPPEHRFLHTEAGPKTSLLEPLQAPAQTFPTLNLGPPGVLPPLSKECSY